VSEHALHDEAANLDAGIFLADLESDLAVARRTPSSTTTAIGASKLVTVANFQTAVPGAASGVFFTAFSDPSVSDALVAFVGSTSAGELGVYSYDIATRQLSRVVDTTTSVPGGADGTFSDFPYIPSVVGQVCVFYAAAGGSASGIYAKKSATGSLSALVTMADNAPSGKAFSFIGTSGRASDGTVATFYGVVGSSNGIYTVGFA